MTETGNEYRNNFNDVSVITENCQTAIQETYDGLRGAVENGYEGVLQWIIQYAKVAEEIYKLEQTQDSDLGIDFKFPEIISVLENAGYGALPDAQSEESLLESEVLAFGFINGAIERMKQDRAPLYTIEMFMPKFERALEVEKLAYD